MPSNIFLRSNFYIGVLLMGFILEHNTVQKSMMRTFVMKTYFLSMFLDFGAMLEVNEGSKQRQTMINIDGSFARVGLQEWSKHPVNGRAYSVLGNGGCMITLSVARSARPLAVDIEGPMGSSIYGGPWAPLGPTWYLYYFIVLQCILKLT